MSQLIHQLDPTGSGGWSDAPDGATHLIWLYGVAYRIANTALALEGIFNGGGTGILYYSPQQCADQSQPLTNCVSGGTWNMWQYSVENACSAMAALNCFGQLHAPGSVITDEISDFTTCQTKAKELADRIAKRLLASHVNTNFVYDDNYGGTITVTGKSVNQGGVYEPSGAGHPYLDETIHTSHGYYDYTADGGGTLKSFEKGSVNIGTQFATDCTTWLINVMGDRIDAAEGSGTCHALYQNVRQHCGYYNAEGRFRGFGYTFNNASQSYSAGSATYNADNTGDNVFSAEWTVGALFACQQILDYLSASLTSDQKVNLKADITAMEDEMKNHQNCDMTKKGCSLTYANRANYHIPFGWIAQANPAMASTGWWIYWLKKMNPWRLDHDMGFNNFIEGGAIALPTEYIRGVQK